MLLIRLNGPDYSNTISLLADADSVLSKSSAADQLITDSETNSSHTALSTDSEVGQDNSSMQSIRSFLISLISSILASLFGLFLVLVGLAVTIFKIATFWKQKKGRTSEIHQPEAYHDENKTPIYETINGKTRSEDSCMYY